MTGYFALLRLQLLSRYADLKPANIKAQFAEKGAKAVLRPLGVAVLLIYLGVFTEWVQFLQDLSNRLISGVLYFDYSSLLVQFMLFLHRLPEMLPSPTQLLAIALTSMILTAVGIKRVVTELQ